MALPAIALQVAASIAGGHLPSAAAVDCFCPPFSALLTSEQTWASTPFGQRSAPCGDEASSRLDLAGFEDPCLGSWEPFAVAPASDLPGSFAAFRGRDGEVEPESVFFSTGRGLAAAADLVPPVVVDRVDPEPESDPAQLPSDNIASSPASTASQGKRGPPLIWFPRTALISSA